MTKNGCVTRDEFRRKASARQTSEGATIKILADIAGRLKPTMFDMVQEFHEKMGIHLDKKPNLLSGDLWDQRLRHLHEEIREYEKAWVNLDKTKMLDALCDLIYVALGIIDFMGVDGDEAFRRVHEANMKKECSPFDGDKQGVFKPEGWVSPDLSDLV